MEEIYSEVNEILNLLGKSYIDRLPKELYNLILKSKDDNYQVKFNSIDEINLENCNKKTINMIALFNLNYWCESEEEKQFLNKTLKENFLKNEKIRSKKFNSDNLFKNTNTIQISKEIVEYKPQNFIQKLLKKIKSIIIKR